MTTRGQDILFETLTGDTGENDAASIQPYADGENAVAAVFNRPTGHVRERTETLRAPIEDLLYSSAADKKWLISSGNSVGEHSTARASLRDWISGTGHFTLDEDILVHTMGAPKTSVAETLAIELSLGNELRFECKKTSFEGANRLRVVFATDTVINLGANLVVTLSGAPEHILQVTFVDGIATAQNLRDAAVAAAVEAAIGLDVDFTGAGSTVLDYATIETALGGDTYDFVATYEREVHFISTTAMHDALAATPLIADGHTLILNMGTLADRRAHYDGSSDITVSAGMLHNVATNGVDKIPNAIPLVRRVGDDLHWIDGTIVLGGTEAIPDPIYFGECQHTIDRVTAGFTDIHRFFDYLTDTSALVIYGSNAGSPVATTTITMTAAALTAAVGSTAVTLTALTARVGDVAACNLYLNNTGSGGLKDAVLNAGPAFLRVSNQATATLTVGSGAELTLTSASVALKGAANQITLSGTGIYLAAGAGSTVWGFLNPTGIVQFHNGATGYMTLNTTAASLEYDADTVLTLGAGGATIRGGGAATQLWVSDDTVLLGSNASTAARLYISNDTETISLWSGNTTAKPSLVLTASTDRATLYASNRITLGTSAAGTDAPRLMIDGFTGVTTLKADDALQITLATNGACDITTDKHICLTAPANTAVDEGLFMHVPAKNASGYRYLVVDTGTVVNGAYKIWMTLSHVTP